MYLYLFIKNNSVIVYDKIEIPINKNYLQMWTH